MNNCARCGHGHYQHVKTYATSTHVCQAKECTCPAFRAWMAVSSTERDAERRAEMDAENAYGGFR